MKNKQFKKYIPLMRIIKIHLTLEKYKKFTKIKLLSFYINKFIIK